MITFSIVGLSEALAKLVELAISVDASAKLAENAGAERIAARARQTVEVRTGHTRDTIRVEDGAVIVDGAARWLEFGTSKMPAEPFLGPAVETESAGVVDDTARIVRVAVARV